MNSPTHTRGKAHWLGQFALYLLLFTLLVSAGVYFFSYDAPPSVAPATPTPAPDAPAGLSGHESPRQSP